MTEPVPPGEMRVSDNDRQLVVERLGQAHGEGRLDLAEYDERVGAAYSSRTFDDLRKLTVDLPQSAVVVPYPGAGRPTWQWQHGVFAVWFMVSFVNLVIWLIVSATSGDFVYPWWIWVAGPWGAVLLAGWLAGRRHGEPR